MPDFDFDFPFFRCDNALITGARLSTTRCGVYIQKYRYMWHH